MSFESLICSIETEDADEAFAFEMVARKCPMYQFTALRSLIVAAIAPFFLCRLGGPDLSAEVIGESRASGSAAGSSPTGPLDGNRFSTDLKSLWKCSAASGYWQCTFTEPRRIGAILQINGDHPELLQNAPRNYTWHMSNDGEVWRPLLETVV